MYQQLRTLAAVIGSFVVVIGSFVVLVSVACDSSSSPTSPTTVNRTSTSGARLTGTITSPSGSSQRLVAFAQTSLDEITVEVQGTDIKTGVRSDGSFTLQGLPVGSFTLLFRDEDGVIIGELTFTDVVDGQAISLLLKLEDDTVTLLEESRDGVVVFGNIDEEDDDDDDSSDDTSDDTSDDASDDNSDDKSGDSDSGRSS